MSILETELQVEEIVPGVARALSPMVRRIPSTDPNTKNGTGTNTYLVGIDEIVVIDPGPLDEAHLDVIKGCGGDLIRWIIVTSPADSHAGSVKSLAEDTGAKVLTSCDIECDEKIGEGYKLVGTEFRLTVRSLPGPSADNIGLIVEQERMLLSGEMFSDRSDRVEAPPSGSISDYITSLESLKKRRLRRIAPAHGGVIENPKVAIQEKIDRLIEREAKLLETLGSNTMRAEELVEAFYGELTGRAAENALNNVNAHMIKLRQDGKIKGNKNFAAV